MATIEEEFPKSAKEAQEHILQIRRDKGLGDGPDQIGNNASDLESALELLSKDLYQTTTHFLLELIQNADDNFYEVPVPTLSITYSPGRVRIDCNERGFSKRNIEAICRICKSTKSGRSKSAGFVGEKGIGFKAVFKVSSQTWISSGHYSFRFDRDAHLGMIAPIWDTFPEKRREGYTSILLKLGKDCDEQHIINELSSYDEKMLLFLRRLRRLEIDITAKKSIFGGSKPFKSIITRQSQTSDNHSMEVLTKDAVNKKYFVWRHSVNNMPSEVRRPGITTSEIVLAFPTTTGEGKAALEPVIASQYVYAFLPIRDSGLPFLLQADFLLPASREDIHQDSPWNTALKSMAAVAFVGAVRYMGDLDNGLRYTWIRYTPKNVGTTGFIEELRRDILKRLQQSKLLESQAGRKLKPKSLVKVPLSWRDSNGTPIISHRTNRRMFLATEYSEADSYYLTLLGVKSMDENSIYNEITRLLRWRTTSFLRKKSKEWHSSFASALLAKQDYRWRQLTIIPLANGKWISSQSAANTLYFPDSATVSLIPEAIELDMLDPVAVTDPVRRRLFAYLGVRELTEADIQTKILVTHSDIKFKPDALSPNVLVSHAEFLYRTFSQGIPPIFAIWMAADQGPCRKGDVMYLPSDIPGAASHILSPNTAKSQAYGFLHKAYLNNRKADGKRWLQYLEGSLQVSVYLRLANNVQQYTVLGGNPHADFLTAMRGTLNQECLTLLRDGWEFYKQWLDTETVVETYNRRTAEINALLAHLKIVKAPCTGSRRSEMIGQTYMPFKRLTREYGTVAPFLDIPDPGDFRWLPLLKCLSVGMSADIGFYLRCLSGAKQNVNFSYNKIRALLHEIENKLDEPNIDTPNRLSLVRSKFVSENFIYIPADGENEESKDKVRRGSWVSTSDCYWQGESWLTQTICLERIYPDLESLFRTHLGIPNSGIEHLIREAAAINKLKTPIEPHLRKLYLAFLAHMRVRGLLAHQAEAIKKLNIFPISLSQANEPYSYLTSIDNIRPWLIADRANLRIQFEHIVPVLAFSVQFILKIKHFLIALGLKQRFLSERATSITEAHGAEVKLHEELTAKYHSRSKYLFRLIPEDQKDEKQLREKFRNVQVYMAPKIFQYWRAPFGLSQVESQPADGAAFLECDYAGDLRIYLRKGYENEVYPYELVEQLGDFFNVPVGQRDILAAALIAPEKRVDELFEARGIAPLVEETEVEEEHDNSQATSAPALYAEPNKKRGSRPGDSRFSRLFSHKRFDSLFANPTDSTPEIPPPYRIAVARATQSAMGRPTEPRTFGTAHTLRSLGVLLKNLEFEQTTGAVVATARTPPAFWDRIFAFRYRDVDLGEIIVSHILTQVLNNQYNEAEMWTRNNESESQATFNFADTQGRFSSFLMRLDGMSGNAQGYTRFTYHIDVKATDTEEFELSQAELDRARANSVHNQPAAADQAPSKHVSILVHITDVRRNPRIRFLADPWDLFEDKQLILETKKPYRARLQLRSHQPPQGGATSADAGFDAVQVREREDRDQEKPSPEYKEKVNGKGKGKEMVQLNGV